MTVSDPGPDPTNPAPCPREVWRAAVRGRRVALTVQPDSRSLQPRVGEQRGDSGGVVITGEITGRQKVGNPHTVSVSVTFTPDGELAPVELEAVKEGGEWTALRAFSFQHRPGMDGELDGAFRFIGTVSGLDIPGGRWHGDGEQREVTA